MIFEFQKDEKGEFIEYGFDKFYFDTENEGVKTFVAEDESEILIMKKNQCLFHIKCHSGQLGGYGVVTNMEKVIPLSEDTPEI